MAVFKCNGVDALELTFDKMANLSGDDLLRIIRPAAELLKTRLSEKVRAIFTQRSGSLANSFKLRERVWEDGAGITVLPMGKHPKSSTGKRHGKRRSNGSYQGTNAEVAYILEFGSPRIDATHFMQNTAEESEQDIYDAMDAELTRILNERGL
nr:MAG TPA: hypothetical protein [Caudoviricetes sp.]